MSEIKVNKISPRTNCGTTQLGDSGDTITIPSGATITNSGTATGFGATGAVNWQTGSIKTANFTGASTEGYFVDTSSSSFTMTLPSSPSAGAIIGIKDYANTFDTNNLIVDRNGSKIGGEEVNLTLQEEGIAITLVFVDSTKGWLVTDSGLQSEASPTAAFITATGGTITTDGNFKVHSFTSPGTFTVCSVGNSAGSNSVDYLVVAGGGGGGGECTNSGGGSGGGAGGLRIGAVTPSSCHSPLVASGLSVTATGFPITVGAGGTAGPQSAPGNGGNGANSIFSTITSTGGGGGGKSVGPSSGSNGGSGGGGRCTAGTGNTPPVSPPQGNNGATGSDNAGGGGATAAGQAAQPSCTGGQSGGNGLNVSPVFGTAPKAFYIANGPDNGASVCGQFAGGGAGGHDPRPAPATSSGGTGGGANVPGPQGNGSAGTTNTGGGGSGGGRDVPQPGSGVGGAGGSGIVLIRYKFQ